MKRFDLAMKMLWRDFRSGELSLLLLAMLIAVSSSTTISLFADRLQRTMSSQAADFLAGDLAIAGPSPLAEDFLQKAAELGLNQAQTLEFSSMLLENAEMQLASIKAVSSNYPLRAYLKISDNEQGEEIIAHQGPEPGSAWVEPSILATLKLKLGDSLTIGEKTLLVTRILNYEPDKRSNFYNYSPRVMFNLLDLPATKILQPGSHVHYAFQFSGNETALQAFKDWVKPKLTPAQRILDIHEDRPELGSALSRAQQYLGLASVVVVLIAGVAIAMTTHRYAERHFNTTALLRCLGAKQQEIIRLFAYQFLLIGLVTSIAGCLLGWIAQLGLFYFLKSLLPTQMDNPSIVAVLFGLVTGMTILLGFALPPLTRLKQVSPLRVLRRDLAPLPASSILIYGMAFSITGVLIWRYTNDLKLTAIILGFGCLALLCLGVVIDALLQQTRKFLGRMSLAWRFGLQGLLRNRLTSIGQILAFSVTLTAMALSYTVSRDLINNWQRQMPEQAPNHFALNIFPEQYQSFQNSLEEMAINGSHFYPVVRGRLTLINDNPVGLRVGKNSQAQEATQRELSLTTAAVLPADNQITEGGDWETNKPGKVSVENKLAESLQINIGDQLSFTVGSEQFQATVVNKRSVQWDTMRPNFYMIFSPGSLDAFPNTYLTSFYLSKDHKNQLIPLHKKYPATTILEVDLILQQLKTLLTQLTQALNLMLYFALLAGFTVLFAAVYASLDQRIYESALLRTFGANIRFLRTMHLIEFGILGGIAGLMAVVTTEAILFALYKNLMHIDYQPKFYLWIALPCIGGFIVSLAGYLGVRKVGRVPPLTTLRQSS